MKYLKEHIDFMHKISIKDEIEGLLTKHIGKRPFFNALFWMTLKSPELITSVIALVLGSKVVQDTMSSKTALILCGISDVGLSTRSIKIIAALTLAFLSLMIFMRPKVSLPRSSLIFSK